MAICGLPVQVHQLSLTFFNEFLLAELVLLPHAASRTTAAEMAATARANVAGRRRRLISILSPYTCQSIWWITQGPRVGFPPKPSSPIVVPPCSDSNPQIRTAKVKSSDRVAHDPRQVLSAWQVPPRSPGRPARRAMPRWP